MSRKLLIVLLAVSLLFNLVFFLFAYLQKAAADEARLMAGQNRARAEQNETKFRQAMKEAERQTQLAIICRSETNK
jgi:hypothetical protein